MANIEIKKCKVGKITKEGLTRNGEPYKMFSVAEGVKDKNGKYQNQYFNCFAQGDLSKQVIEGVEVALSGSLNPNNWEKDGKKHYGQSLYVKNLLPFGTTSAGTKTENIMDGFTDVKADEPMELPFD